MMKRLTLWFLAFASIVAFTAGESAAQEPGYPRKPIRWVVPYAAGSPLDINIRKFADVTQRKLNGTIVVDNKGGAGGVIGTTEVAKAAPDGYTFLATVGDPLIASTAVVKAVPYDPLRDFTFITKFSNGYTPLTIGAELKIETMAQLIEAAKKQPLTLKYASIGPGSFPQLIMEELNRMAGIKIQEIAYRSPPQAMQALLTSEVDIYFASPAQAQEYVAQGKGRLLAAQSKSALFPNVPTYAEAGYNSTILNTPLWVGLLGPARMPHDLVDLTLTALKNAYAEEEVKAFFATTRTQIVLNTPEEFEREFRAENGAVIPLIKALGIEPQ
jgi:tripartite-type tricarboxylate transporter receptor subunit TctC